MAAQAVAVRADRTDNDERAVQLRRVETYLSVLTAVVKVVTVVALVYIGWTWLMPTGSTKVAAIGAGTVFVVLAGATIGPVLRDITAGSIMIIERWFNVGDYIRVEPFAELGGVVEQVTLRSTKIRSLNGEVIWVHNQYIQGVRMTPRGIRTIHIDIIVRNLHVGRELVERVTSTLPTGTMTLLQKPTIVREEQWAKERWFLTIEGKTPPGREWLMENYFVESLKELDEESAKPALTRIPIVRYADPAAERSFKRAVRTANSANK
jgi:small conductance mechanosensitive channel